MLPREVYTFSPGPCILPLELLKDVKQRIPGDKKSILEISPHSAEFKSIVDENKRLLRDILKIPENYEVFFTEGGASFQFATVPINFLKSPEDKGLYIVTGNWSESALKEAKKYGKGVQVNELLKKGQVFSKADYPEEAKIDKSAKYLYYCDNETIYGVEYSKPPESYGVPLVTDMTSNFLSKPIDVAKFGLIYAGSQKNYAPPGLCTLIIRKDLISDKCAPNTPSAFHFSKYLKEDSHELLPVFDIYFMNLYLKWIRASGGVEVMHELALKKSNAIYSLVEKSGGFYRTTADKDSRSRMNIPFIIQKDDDAVNKSFLKEAEKNSLLQLQGHRSVGGMRASIYNGMPVQGVDRLKKFMTEFKEAVEQKPKL